MYLAPLSAELGRTEDAGRTVAKLLKLQPGFTIEASVQKHLPYVPQTMSHYVQGLRKAMRGGGNMNGSLPNISYIDVASRKLIRQEKPTTRALNTGHFYTSDNNDLVVVSAPRDGNRIRLGGLSIQPDGKAMKTVTSPKKVVSQMLGESLSVTIHQSIALVTHPDGNMISFWDTTNRKFIKKLALEIPRGVTLSNNGKYFIVSYGQMANIVNISTNELELKNDSITEATYLAGSHVYNWTTMVQELCS
jgi:hypothetical protein